MSRKRIWLVALILLAVGAGGSGYYYFQVLQSDRLPDTIASGNGRVEVEEIHVAAEYGGRVTEVRVDEGAMVEASDVLAILDTAELEANLERADAERGRSATARPAPRQAFAMAARIRRPTGLS